MSATRCIPAASPRHPHYSTGTVFHPCLRTQPLPTPVHPCPDMRQPELVQLALDPSTLDMRNTSILAQPPQLATVVVLPERAPGPLPIPGAACSAHVWDVSREAGYKSTTFIVSSFHTRFPILYSVQLLYRIAYRLWPYRKICRSLGMSHGIGPEMGNIHA